VHGKKRRKRSRIGPSSALRHALRLLHSSALASSDSVAKLSLASTGSAPQPQMIASGQTSPSGIAIDEANVYWANTGSSMGSGSIAKVAIAGGSVVTIASGLSGPVSLAVDARYVYWVNSADGSVMKTPK
jgi:hypothetical protein